MAQQTARLHRLSRRMFLTEFGKGTMAVALVGGTISACGDGEASSPDPTVEKEPSGFATTAPPPTTTEPPPPTTTIDPNKLRWERASLGFVSAYVLVRRNEVMVVDTGAEDSVQKMTPALDALGVDWSDVGHVVLTHMHGDHVGGLGAVLEASPDAIAYAGERDVAAIANPLRPITAVNDGDDVMGLQVIGTPGHTPGHISMFDKDAGLMVAGDALVGSPDGGIDGPSEDFTANMGEAVQSVKRMSNRRYDTVLFGHGEPVIGMASQLVADLAVELGA